MSESEYSFNVTAENFAEIVVEKSRDVPVLIDFWATWCGPCQALMPVLAKLAEEYQGKFILAKINSDEQQELASAFSVRSIPTVKIFRHGEVVDEFMGAQPESAIREILKRHIESETDTIRDKVREEVKSGNVDTAIDILQQALVDEPEDINLKLDLIRLYIAIGEIEKAETAFNTVPVSIQIEPQGKQLQALLCFSSITANAPDKTQLEQSFYPDKNNLEACYQLAAHKVLDQEYESALELLLDIVRKDRTFHEDAGRKSILMIFDLLGEEHELTKKYRKRLSMYLY